MRVTPQPEGPENIGNPEEYSIIDMAHLIGRLTGREISTVHFIKVSWSPKDVVKGSQRYTFFATSEDYLRIAKTIMNDYKSDSCIGDYLRMIYDNRVDKKKKEYVSNKGVAQYSRQYGGQFHFPKIGKNIVFGMDGYAGQQILIDITNGRIVIIHTIDQHYDWNKIGLSVIKN